MKIILKIVCSLFVLMSSQSYAQQTQSLKSVTTSVYNFNIGSVRNHSGFTRTLGKQRLSSIFDSTYGLKHHFDVTKVTKLYKQNLLSDTFVDTSFIYKKEIPGTPPFHTNVTNLEGFIFRGFFNTIFN